MPEVSIIIPIFNSEKHLKKCLGSIASQTFTDFEVLMIDDGSDDGTADICKNFAESDARFKYFYKQNGGVSSARNLGLKKTEGEYIAFIDSDDYIDSDYLYSLTKPLEECKYDIVQSGMKLIKNGTETKLAPENSTLSGQEYIAVILKRRLQIFLFQSPVAKLYRRDIISGNELCFDETVSISEDCLFNTELLNHNIKNVCFTDYCGYNYLQDNSTLTKRKADFSKVKQSLQVGIKTASIRNSLIEKYSLQSDPDILKGFSQAICIIYLSNAHLIETGEFTGEEKEQLYNIYFSKMDYPVLPSLNEYDGTDKKIIEASFEKNSDKIAKIYNLRQRKQKIKSLLHLR